MKKPRAIKTRPLSATSIIKKNLFDPNRGSGPTIQTEVPSANGQTSQNFVLHGTMITPENRRAIIQVPENIERSKRRGKSIRRAGQIKRKSKVHRVDLGDRVGGFELADIEPGKITLTRGAERIELVIDLTRKRVIPKTPSSPTPTKKSKNPTRKTPRRRAGRG